MYRLLFAIRQDGPLLPSVKDTHAALQSINLEIPELLVRAKFRRWSERFSTQNLESYGTTKPHQRIDRIRNPIRA